MASPTATEAAGGASARTGTGVSPDTRDEDSIHSTLTGRPAAGQIAILWQNHWETRLRPRSADDRIRRGSCGTTTLRRALCSIPIRSALGISVPYNLHFAQPSNCRPGKLALNRFLDGFQKIVASIVFTGTSARAVNNWLPAFHRLQASGHLVRSLLFPNTADPDHDGLRSLGFPSLARIPIPESLRRIAPTSVRSLASAGHEAFARDPADAIVLTTCHAGPEAELARVLAAGQSRPVVIGCQHGYVQNWTVYWDRFSFDRFLVFGEHFRREAPEILRNRIAVAGLPKLDAIRREVRPPFHDDTRPILYAAQTKVSDDLIRMLNELAVLAGREVLVRPHPEFPHLFDGTGLTLTPEAELFAERMSRSSLLVTTGSTAVLEALVSGCPAVVLPIERGDEYREAGIVTDSISATEVLAVAERQDTRDEQRRLSTFLTDMIGPTDGNAANRTAELIESFLTRRDVPDR